MLTPDEIKRGREKLNAACECWQEISKPWLNWVWLFGPSLLTIAEQQHALTAENARLRALVEEAYEEGWLGKHRDVRFVDAWYNSQAKKKLEGSK